MTVSLRPISQMRITCWSTSHFSTRSGMACRSATRRLRRAFFCSDLSIMKVMFARILTLIAILFMAAAHAQAKGDDQVLEAWQASKQGNRAKLAQLLPQVQGHALEPWVAYWELRSRLDTALPQEVQDFFTKYAGTYQEDRLRNDWLLLLGQRRDWTNFAGEYPKYRMNDDREVRCYALLVQHLREGANAPAALPDEVRKLWFAQRDADDGCALAAS